ncbi:MAG TPA: RHS repeat-associated core domain-containing protein [Thermomicrobiales bacterium]|jgi:RHS repeat-associated protein
MPAQRVRTDATPSAGASVDTAGGVRPAILSMTRRPGAVRRGNPHAASGESGAFGLAGDQWDPETGLTYLRDRYYAPASGRFLTRDTVQPNAGGTQGWNPYAYATGNPVTFADPSGHGVAGVFAVVARVLECALHGECRYRRQHEHTEPTKEAVSGTPSAGHWDGGGTGGIIGTCSPSVWSRCMGGVPRGPYGAGPSGNPYLRPTAMDASPWTNPPSDPFTPDATTGTDDCIGAHGLGPSGLAYWGAIPGFRGGQLEELFTSFWLDDCQAQRMIYEDFNPSLVTEIAGLFAGALAGLIIGGVVGGFVGGVIGAVAGFVADQFTAQTVQEAIVDSFTHADFREAVKEAANATSSWGTRPQLPGLVVPQDPLTGNDGNNPLTITIFTSGKGKTTGRYVHTQMEWQWMNPCADRFYICAGEPPVAYDDPNGS